MTEMPFLLWIDQNSNFCGWIGVGWKKMTWVETGMDLGRVQD